MQNYFITIYKACQEVPITNFTLYRYYLAYITGVFRSIWNDIKMPAIYQVRFLHRRVIPKMIFILETLFIYATNSNRNQGHPVPKLREGLPGNRRYAGQSR